MSQTSHQPPITSSELAGLWLTYQQKTMFMRMLEYFIDKADDEKAKDLMTGLYENTSQFVQKISDILQSEGAALPVGFTAEDVNLEVPKLYDHGFDIIFVRLMKEISMSLHTFNLTMSYREDIVLLFKEITAYTQGIYNESTQYLLEKGLIVRPPFVTMPTSAAFVEDASYLGGFAMNPFSEKRVLNTVEVAIIHHAIESNAAGMQMILGFAQCANDPEIKKYFAKGAELAKGIIKELSETLLQSDIQTPIASGGHATNAVEAPFSDKLMMYCIGLFCSFSTGSNSLGTAFSLRNDLPAKMAIIMKDIVEYAHEGGKIMIRNGWMEEPPQMEQRKKLINV